MVPEAGSLRSGASRGSAVLIQSPPRGPPADANRHVGARAAAREFQGSHTFSLLQSFSLSCVPQAVAGSGTSTYTVHHPVTQLPPFPVCLSTGVSRL